jgi:hypothetical protein
MSGRTAILAIVCAAAGACATHQVAARLPAAAPPPPHDGALHISLTWDAPVDLDLYVTDPLGETLYFANNPTRAGAQLEQDARCATLPAHGPAIERARLLVPLPGRYRVGVDFIDACGASVTTVPFRIAVDRGTAHRGASGTIGPGQFVVVAIEIDVHEDGFGDATPSASP